MDNQVTVSVVQMNCIRGEKQTNLARAEKFIDEAARRGSRLVVLPELTAKHIGSGTVPVLATPMMIALMEKTCRLSVKPFLDEGQETVGTHERFIIDEKKFGEKMSAKQHS